MSYKQYYNRYFSNRAHDLHFAAHSHHPWPDCSFEAHMQYWDLSNKLLDQKWDYIFSRVVPEFQTNIAGLLGSNPERIIFAPNTHELVYRILSSFYQKDRVKILSSNHEFHSFRRQSQRWSEWEKFEITTVDVKTSEQFQKDLLSKCQIADIIFFSQVFFDLGLEVEEINSFLSQLVSCSDAVILLDGYHSFFAFPQNFSEFANRVFLIGGGYKYGQAGEGACFVSCPDTSLRPMNSGWFAEFANLEDEGQTGVGYANNGFRFAGATLDASAIFRSNCIFRELQINEKLAEYHSYCRELKSYFIKLWQDSFWSEKFETPLFWNNNSHYISFKSKSAPMAKKLLEQNSIVTDCRGEYLRFGFGIYQDYKDIDNLFQRMNPIYKDLP